MLDGFVVFNDKKSNGISMTITKNGVSFGNEVKKALNSPQYIQILFNYDAKAMAIRACDESDAGALKFAKKNNARTQYIRYTNKELLKQIGYMINEDLKNYRGKIISSGEIDKDEQTIVFSISLPDKQKDISDIFK